jgi:hypothetical protein
LVGWTWLINAGPGACSGHSGSGSGDVFDGRVPEDVWSSDVVGIGEVFYLICFWNFF